MSEYTLHTKSNGSLIINANLETPNANVVGQSQTYEFWFPDFEADLYVDGSYTVTSGTTETYDNVIVDDGGTLTVEGTLQCNKTVVDGNIVVNGTLSVSDGYTGTDIRDVLTAYQEWGGKYDTQTMLNGEVKYRERIPSTEPIDSLVVGIEPDVDLANNDVNGVWGILDGVTDARGPTLNVDRLRMSLTVLAEYGDYTDHSALESALQL